VHNALSDLKKTHFYFVVHNWHVKQWYTCLWLAAQRYYKLESKLFNLV